MKAIGQLSTAGFVAATIGAGLLVGAGAGVVFAVVEQVRRVEWRFSTSRQDDKATR